jgi:parallel beta-helix repeat protein
MRRLCALLLSAVLLFACGGSSGGGSSTGGGGGGGPTPVPSDILYVRASGDDTNSGKSPDEALQSIVHAAQLLRPGTTVYVGPGHYPGRVEITGVAGTADSPATLVADITGEHTGDSPGDVVLNANGDVLALRISKSPYTIIDGFTITGANPSSKSSATAIQVRSTSTNVTIRNCSVSNNVSGDGIRVLSSDDVLIFNNLIVDDNNGIRITDGSQNTRIISNTIADNAGTGVAIGGKNSAGVVPTGTTLLNNVIQDSKNKVNISVDTGPPSSLTHYTGDFNLVFFSGLSDQTTSYRPASIRGNHDVNQDAKFDDSANGDYHLADDSPAVNAGTNSIDAALLTELEHRTTSSDGTDDKTPVDIGYHYPPAP